MAKVKAEQRLQSPRMVAWKRQHLMLSLAATTTALLVLGFGASALITPPQVTPPVPKRSEPALFVPTQAQLLNLAITPVSTMNFRSETVTDGYIAVDEDLSTPVFSPFSGRVTQILA